MVYDVHLWFRVVELPLGASCALWGLCQGFTHEWRITKLFTVYQSITNQYVHFNKNISQI